MKFSYDIPGRTTPAVVELFRADVLSELASTAERVGFSGFGLDDHPAPPERWRLDPAGHDGLDPFLGLACVAAATSRLRLITNLAIVGYRPPLLLAKLAASLDVICGGRLTLGLGVGYLPEEHRAMGADFDLRNHYFDEAIDVCRRAWSGQPFSGQGLRYDANDTTVSPPPEQRPHPPIWIGGNSRLSLERVASIGDGWLTLPNRRDLAISRRTGVLEGVEDLKRYLQVLWQLCDERGRSTRPDVGYVIRPGTARGTAELLDLVGELEGLGVTWLIWPGPGTTRTGAIDAIATFGVEVIAASSPPVK